MTKQICALLIAAMAVLVLAYPQTIPAGDAFSLLSVEEAKELQLGDAEWEAGAIPKSAGLGIGPKIVFEAPEVQATDKGLLIDSPSTMSLLVVFKDNISPVDMKTLKIRARKGWFSKNLTDRLAPYLSGTSLKAENVKIPAGRFKLEIKIADTSGHESVQEYLCQIRE